MRPRLLSLALVALLAAACGASGGSSTPNPTATTNDSPAASQAAPSAGGGTGAVDCAALQPAGPDLVVGVQILAQMRTPDVVAQVKSGTLGAFDADHFVASMEALHVLDGYASPLGDPKPAIDAYVQAGKAAKELLAKDTVTQADVDAYLQNVGSVGDFIGKQMAISGAMTQAGCG